MTSRGHVAHVAPEYGVASLVGNSISEGALQLIRIAHPKFREKSLKDVRKYYCMPEYQYGSPT